jgi:peptide deformylase
MLKPLVPTEDPLLHKRIKKCSYNLDRSQLSYTLTENMFHYNGVGLSANQIGIEERVFVMMIDIELEETITCFNPKIIKESKKDVVMEEGCLSYPKLFLDISRPSSIIVRYEDEGKTIIKRRLEGFIGRIFQHEYDHMEGIDFTQRS